ncbi:MAG: hypothetical protein Q8O07_02840, partial [Chloroflexota bacterium]|nr:hypothetical protein [Chloroflexota bacterium]
MTSGFKAPSIIDNLGANTLQETLAHLLRDCQAWDVATGTFEVGSLLALDGAWQPVDKIRVLMGDETTARTRAELVATLNRQSEDSIEAQKERDDDEALAGLAAVRRAL